MNKKSILFNEGGNGMIKNNEKTGSQSIFRIWKGRTKKARADNYLNYILSTGYEDYTATAGNVSAKVLRRFEDDVCHFITISEWNTLEALKNFAGEDYKKARYYPKDKEFLLELKEEVLHYECYDPLIQPQENISAQNFYGLEFIETSATTRGLFSLGRSVLSSSDPGPPWHKHANEDEWILVISGKIKIDIGHKQYLASSGEICRLPKNEWHKWKVISNTPAEIFFFFAPAGIEEMFKAWEKSPQKRISIGERYGVIFK